MKDLLKISLCVLTLVSLNAFAEDSSLLCNIHKFEKSADGGMKEVGTGLSLLSEMKFRYAEIHPETTDQSSLPFTMIARTAIDPDYVVGSERIGIRAIIVQYGKMRFDIYNNSNFSTDINTYVAFDEKSSYRIHCVIK